MFISVSVGLKNQRYVCVFSVNAMIRRGEEG